MATRKNGRGSKAVVRNRKKTSKKVEKPNPSRTTMDNLATLREEIVAAIHQALAAGTEGIIAASRDAGRLLQTFGAGLEDCWRYGPQARRKPANCDRKKLVDAFYVIMKVEFGMSFVYVDRLLRVESVWGPVFAGLSTRHKAHFEVEAMLQLCEENSGYAEENVRLRELYQQRTEGGLVRWANFRQHRNACKNGVPKKTNGHCGGRETLTGGRVFQASLSGCRQPTQAQREEMASHILTMDFGPSRRCRKKR